MSRSPRTTLEKDSLAKYRAAWQSTSKLLREGHSFSGHERNCAFLNSRDNRFANVSSVTGLDFDDDGRSIGVTDWDQDGDLDIWFHNRTGPRLRMMRNQTISAETNSDQHFVAFRLQGTVSNRDAIGARITLFANGEKQPFVQTLYAGDAYLSQSTKWLHFGMGRSERIEKAIIRWPNGATEEFSDLEIDSRYKVVEGSGECVTIPPRNSKLAIGASKQPELKPRGLSRTFFSNRLPLPILEYRELDEPTNLKTIDVGNQPRLIVLWASWCPRCVRELKFLAENADQIREAGLQVVALSLDGLDGDHATDASDAIRIIERIGFPFDAGLVTRESLAKLELLQELQFNRMQPTAVPASFLVSSTGELSAKYRGHVDWTTISNDLSQLSASLVTRRQQAVPFTGRWTTPPKQILMRAIAQQFKTRGFEQDYARYLELDSTLIQRRRAVARTQAERLAFDRHYASANFNLGISLVASGQAPEAIEYFRRAVDAHPNHVDALTNLGVLLAKRRQVDTAIDLFERALEVDPKAIKARANLAAAMGASKRYSDAIDHYKVIVELEPSNSNAHSRLGRFLLETGQIKSAIPYLENAVRLNAKDFGSSVSLAWLRATHPDESIRDAAAAMKIADRVRQLGSGSRTIILDVLAAALAEDKQFDRAAKEIQTAIATLPPNHSLRRSMSSRLEAYKLKKPFRDPDGKYP